MSTTEIFISWAARVIVAVILLQTLFFKFAGAEESKYIFTTLMGAELEWVGRIGSGIVELFAAIMLLVPRTASIGAFIALGTISGAIFSHLTMLGIEVKGDGGLLFGLALVVSVLSGLTLLLHRRELPVLGHVFQ